MDGSLESLINLYVFTTGRRLFALGQVREIAAGQGFAALTGLCDTAILHDQATREIESRWAGESKSGGTNPEAQRIDALVDRALTAIRDHAVAQTQGAPAADPIHHQVDAFLKRLFPLGVYDVTSKPYVDELAAVEDILALLKGELAPTATDLGLDRLTKRLGDLASQYRDALEAPGTSLTFGKVRAARSEGQGLLLEVVSVILGKHHERTPAGTAARLALLGPILKQNDAIGDYLRARRAVDDVDPTTGQEAPAGPTGPSAATGPTGPSAATAAGATATSGNK
ncbi:MAG: hypothetical protein QM820_23035 [Minicystis sp.]